MPFSFRLILELTGTGVPRPEHLRAFASGLFERGVTSDHGAPIKPYTIGRPVPLGGGAWTLDVTTLTDTATELLVERSVPGTGVLLGPLSGVVAADPVTIAGRPWEELAEAPPITGMQLSFDTPVVFRRQGGQHPRPTPTLIFGHLRRRWRNLAPETAPDVSFRDVEFDLSLDGTKILLQGPGSHDPETGRSTGRTIAGFAGTATVGIVAATWPERIAFGALSEAAPFLGMGASTTSGFGAVSLLALWVDD